jgi:ABC-2 type transport system permease protein
MAAKKEATRNVRFINTLILFVALLAVLVMVNILSTYLFGRVDLTQNKVNSLSLQSIEVLQGLTGEEGVTPIEVRLYVSRELPDKIKSDWGQELLIRGVDVKLKDKLDEYRSHAEEMFQIVEVTGDVEKKAEEAGVQPFVSDEATVTEGKLEMTRYVLGCTFHYEGEVEVYPKALDPNFFEFEITKRLLRLKDRVEHGRKIQHLTAASDAIWEALEDCTGELTAFEVKEDEKQEVSGIEGLLKPIENMEEEAQALHKNKDRIVGACSSVRTVLESKGLKWKGEHKRFDAFLRGLGTKEQTGGVEAFVEVFDNLEKHLVAEEPNIQKILEIKRLLVALKNDSEAFRDMLKKAPGQRRIGFICGHDEFCPFPSEKPVIDPKIAQMMGQQNPIHQRFLEVALQLQGQVNQILQSIGNGLFTDKDFDVTRVDASKPISEDIAAVVLFATRGKLSDRERYEIDQFMLRGGTLLVFVDNFNVSLASFSEQQIKEMGPFNPNPRISNDYFAIEANGSNIDELLAPYGVVVNKDLIIDAVNNNKVTLPHSVRKGKLVIRGTKDFDYPMVVYAKDFDRSNVVVRSLPGLTLPYVSSLEYEEKAGHDVEVSHLVKSSDTAISLMDPTSVPVLGEGEEAEMLKTLPPDLMTQAKELTPNGPHTLMMMVTGKFQSAFKDKEEPPKPPEEPEVDEEGNPRPEKKEFEYERLNEGEGRMLVVGSSLGIAPLTQEGVFKDVNIQDITQGGIMVPQVRLENWKIKLNQLRRAFAETIPVMFNILDWAVQRSALADIRAKNYSFRPIENVEEEKQKLITYAAVGGLPFLFILFGIVYWQLRVVRRRKLTRGMQSRAAAATARAGAVAQGAQASSPPTVPGEMVAEAPRTTEETTEEE